MNAWRIRFAHRLKAIDVIDVLSDLFILRGVPADALGLPVEQLV